jgi:hypothetical protein
MDFIVQFTPLGVLCWQKPGSDFVHGQFFNKKPVTQATG